MMQKTFKTIYRTECSTRADKFDSTYYLGGEKGTCFEHECEYGALCLMKKRRPVCECPECAEEFDPVCGTDGISYINECKLNKEACEQRKKIAVAYQGLCSK
ncbi:hypothetical protein AVEN_197574-1 [Araneus ventricosus]|uniref:Kazal-like domain-containing protein n=1 Tax=Araneus ventricosus TaxID=182803 RepID=A0A4Y2SNJ5_ARAVE|nr:hypothetical protein AVEN_197574-1 [Araneus ventricosus]